MGHGMDLSDLLNGILSATKQSEKAIDNVVEHAKDSIDEVAEYAEQKTKQSAKKITSSVKEEIEKSTKSNKNNIVDNLIDIESAKQRIKDLQKSMTTAAQNITKVLQKTTIGMNDYGSLSIYAKTLQRSSQEIDDLKNKLKQQGVTIRNAGKEYRDLASALNDLHIAQKKVETSSVDGATAKPNTEKSKIEKTKDAKVQEVVNRISTNSSINGIKNLEQEAVNVTRALSTMYDDGIRDTEEYITLQYKLSKILDKMGQRYGGVRKGGFKDLSDMRQNIFDNIKETTGTDIINMSGVMNDLLGDSEFSLFNKSLSKLGMKEIAEFLIMTGKQTKVLDSVIQQQEQVNSTIEETIEQRKEEVKQAEDAQQKIQEAYKSTADIIKESASKHLGNKNWMHEIFDAKDSTQAKKVLDEIDSRLNLLETDAKQAKFEWDSLNTAIFAYTGDNLKTKTDFQNAIKDAWKQDEKEAAAKLFARYQERFPTGKFDPNKAFGEEWSANFEKNLANANRSLTIWRGQLKSAAEEYGKFVAYHDMGDWYNPGAGTMGYKHMAQGHLEKLQQQENAALEKQRKQELLNQQAHERFDVTDKTVAYNNLCEAVEEYNNVLAEQNRLLEQKEKFEDIDSRPNALKEFEELNADGKFSTPAQYIMSICKQLGEAADRADDLKVGLTRALHVYRELGGTEMPNLGEDLLKEIDIPAQDVSVQPQADVITNIIQLTDDYGENLDEINNKLMQGTKFLNELGQIIRLFHNSSAVFDKFDTSKSGIRQGVPVLGKGNYLALSQNGKFNDTKYGRYQTQWYANINKIFDAENDILSLEQINNIIDKFLPGLADGDKKNYINKFVKKYMAHAVKYVAQKANTEVADIWNYLGYDAVQLGEQINIFDASKLHRANNIVFDAATGKFNTEEELFKRSSGSANAITVPTEPEMQPKVIEKEVQENIGGAPVKVPVEPTVEAKSSILDNYTSNYTKQQMAQILNGVSVDDITAGLKISKNDQSIISEKFNKLASIVADNTMGDGSEWYDAYEEFVDFLTKSSQQYVENNQQEIRDNAKAFLNFMQNKQFSYTDSDKAEFGDEWKSVSKMGFGGWKNRKMLFDKNAQPLDDSRYAEIVSEYSKYFSIPQEVLAQQNKLQQIVQMIKMARDVAGESLTKIIGFDESDKTQIYSKVANLLGVINNNASNMKRSINGATEEESAFADEATRAAGAMERQKSAANDVGDDLDDDDTKDDQKLSIVERRVEDALAKLRNANDNKTSLIDLKDVESVDQLESQIRSMAQGILGSDLSIDSVIVQDDIARISMYNEELGVTAAQTYQLKKATDDAKKAQLEFVSSIYKHSPRQQNKYSETQASQVAKDDRWLVGQLSKLNTQERKYKYSQKKIDGKTAVGAFDETTLKNEANVTIDKLAEHIKQQLNNAFGAGVSSELRTGILNDLRVLENEIKIAQYDKYASLEMQPSEVSEARKELENLLNTLEAKAQKKNVFEKVSDDLDGLRKKLTDENSKDYVKSGTDISSVAKQLSTVKSAITAEIAMQDAQIAKYKEILSLTKKVNEAKLQHKSAYESGEDTTIYSKQIQSYNEKINKLKQDANLTSEQELELEKLNNDYIQKKSKLLDDIAKKEKDILINKEKESQKQIQSIYDRLLSSAKETNSIDSKINEFGLKNIDSGNYSSTLLSLQGKKSQLVDYNNNLMQEISETFKIELDNNVLDNFFNIAVEKSALTIEQVQKLKDELRQSNEIGFNFAAKVLDTVEPTINKLQDLLTMVKKGAITDQKTAENIVAANLLEQDKLKRFKASPDTASGLSLLQETNDIKAYVDQVYNAIAAEQKYFQGKEQYKTGTTMSDIANDSKNAVKQISDAQQKLSDAAKDFAGDNNAIITNFTQTSDGISHLDFSVFDKSTGQLKKFKMEMGSLNDTMYYSEVATKKTISAYDATANQLEVITGLMDRFKESGISDSSAYTRLSAEAEKLSSALSSNADDTTLNTLIKDAKISAAEVEKLYKKYVQLQSAIDSGDATNLGTIDVNGNIFGQITSHIQEFAQSQQSTIVDMGKFNDTTGKMKVSMQSADGTLQEFAMSFDGLGKRLVAQRTGIKDLGSQWDQLKVSLKKAGKQFVTAFAGANVFYKAISEARKGVAYVKEIDLAMTELKKVTDEAESSYDRFLKTAGKTAGTIGSTLSDFTEATANFARLGYSIEESANMAKTAIVYKNVADGLDSVEESTDSIISTMKAFGIESDDTMSIVDRFNEVGNKFAITSAGIGDALQRSASALYEAGNSIDESIALVTAAM